MAIKKRWEPDVTQALIINEVAKEYKVSPEVVQKIITGYYIGAAEGIETEEMYLVRIPGLCSFRPSITQIKYFIRYYRAKPNIPHRRYDPNVLEKHVEKVKVWLKNYKDFYRREGNHVKLNKNASSKKTRLYK